MMLGSRVAADLDLVPRTLAPARRVQVLRVPVAVDLSWLLGWALATWTLADSVMPAAAPGHGPLACWLAGGATALVLLLSLAVHEAAHGIAARREGILVRRITLSLFGGATECEHAPHSPGVAFRISAAGPVASLGTAAVAAGTHVALVEGGADPLVALAAAIAAVGNLGVAILNLAPGLPLDGGGILVAGLWRLTGHHDQALRLAARAGRLVSGGVIAVALLAGVSGDTPLALWSGLVGFAIWTNGPRAESA